MSKAADYPNLWKRGLIQKQVKARAAWRCEHCGMQFSPWVSKAISARRKDGQPMILTVHHLDGDKCNCTMSNLVSLCQRCHLHVQALWQPGQPLPLAWQTAPAWLVSRNLPYQQHPQMRMFSGG